MSTPAEAENPFAGQGSVLLDIGDEVGAVVVAMPDGMEGVEVEIRPDGVHHHGHDRGDDHPSPARGRGQPTGRGEQLPSPGVPGVPRAATGCT